MTFYNWKVYEDWYSQDAVSENAKLQIVSQGFLLLTEIR